MIAWVPPSKSRTMPPPLIVVLGAPSPSIVRSFVTTTVE